jgi:dihydrolipoamide dehydrogenase
MVQLIEARAPDLGGFTNVSVIDVLVKPGDQIQRDGPLITLETEKASMDVPSEVAGVIDQVHVSKGGKVSAGDLIATVRLEGTTIPVEGRGAASTRTEPAMIEAAVSPEDDTSTLSPVAEPISVSTSAGKTQEALSTDRRTQFLVLGSGPGGYTAAFRAADLGLKVTLVERFATLGGVCLNVGCIPSKALLHAAKVIDDANSMAGRGVSFGKPTLNLDELRAWKASVVKKLTGGLKMLATQRKVDVVVGTGKLVSPNVIQVIKTDGNAERIAFDQCIIAAGSEAVKLPFLPKDPRIVSSTGALELPPNTKRLLVIGGGIIGLELATVYEALDVKVSVVELTPNLMPGADPDLVKPLEKRLRARYEAIYLGLKVTNAEALAEGIRVTFEGVNAPDAQLYDLVLVCVGRAPNADRGSR